MRAKRVAVITAMLATACWIATGGLEPASAELAITAKDASAQPDPLPATVIHAEQSPGPGASSMTQADDPVDTLAAAGGPPGSGRLWRNSLGMEFVPIPGTNLLFCKWETRVQDYAAFVRRTGRKWPKPKIEQDPMHPAVNVTWDDANAFCEWLTEREQKVGLLPDEGRDSLTYRFGERGNEVGFMPTGCRYRLPADLEWSVAVGGLGVETGKTPYARNGKIIGVYPWDGPFPPPAGAGNYAPVRETDTYQYTAPVGSFATNRYGLCDMSGNVSEWCLDGWLQESFTPGPGDRTLRGGSWFHSTPWHLVSSAREKAASNFDDIRIGFRVVLELPAR